MMLRAANVLTQKGRQDSVIAMLARHTHNATNRPAGFSRLASALRGRAVCRWSTMDFGAYQRRDAALQEIGFASYREYLDSELWAKIRRMAFAKWGHICNKCRDKAELIHHANYSVDTLLGRDLSGLVPVCHACHTVAELDRFGNKGDLHSANKYLGCTKSERKERDRVWAAGRVRPKKQPHEYLSVKVTEAGQPCPHCGTPVVKRIVRRKPKLRQNYAFHWYLYCKTCRKMYMVEAAKYTVDHSKVAAPRYGPGHCSCGNKKKRGAAMCKACQRTVDALCVDTEIDASDQQHLVSIAGECRYA